MRWRACLLLVVCLVLAGCGDAPAGQEPETPRPVSRRARACALLERGAAWLEIQAFSQAHGAFSELRRLEPHEPAAAFNLALNAYRQESLDVALHWLQQTGEAEGGAAVQRLAAALSYERNDPQEQWRALLRAYAHSPEAALAYQAAKLAPQVGEDARGIEFMQQAFMAWPDNLALASAWLRACAASQHAEHRAQVPALVESLGKVLDDPAVLEDARLAAAALQPVGAAEVPYAIQVLCNLVRAAPRFRTDAALLQERLELRALRAPLSWELRKRAAFAQPALQLEPRDPPAGLLSGLRAVVPVSAGGDSLRVRVGWLACGAEQLVWLPPDGPAKIQSLALPDVQEGLACALDGDLLQEVVLRCRGGVGILALQAGQWQQQHWLPGSWTQVLVDDIDNDQDLDLLLLDGSDSLSLMLNRGPAGLAPLRALLRKPGRRWRAAAAIDLDGDLDRELVMAGADSLDCALNLRQGRFAFGASQVLPPGIQQLQVADYTGDGQLDLLASGPQGWRFLRGSSDGLRPDPIADACSSAHAPTGSPQLADLDRDGDLDLLAAGAATASGLWALENLGDGLFRAEPRLLPQRAQPLTDCLVADLDGDHHLELLAWDLQSTVCWSLRGADQDWLGLRLKAPTGKAPPDARGALVRLFSGDRVQTRVAQGPYLELGLGGQTPALLQATWPNGISEYRFDLEAGQSYDLELVMRLEGSCPFLYAWDGQRERFVTDLIGTSPLGLLVAPGIYAPADPDEYLLLPDWLQPRDGAIELLISEELREVAYYDACGLVAVDAPEGVWVGSADRWARQMVDGLQLCLLEDLRPPVDVRVAGQSRLDEVRTLDGVHLQAFPERGYYPGGVASHSIELELPAELAADPHPQLLLLGWLHWSNTSINVARAQDPTARPLFPRLEVADGQGGWRLVCDDAGLPAGKTKPLVIDLSGELNPRDPRVRLSTNFEVYWDQLLVGRRSAAEPRVQRVAPAFARLSFGGFARASWSGVRGPLVFDRSDLRPHPWRVDSQGREVALVWQEMEGFRSAFGEVSALLGKVDDRMVVFGDGEQLRVRFPLAGLEPVPEGWRRHYLLFSHGWVKDGDLNVGAGQTVLPLPSNSMQAYPDGPPNPDVEALNADHLTRWVGRQRLRQRLESAN